jgi:hypothetical protein
MDTLEAGWWFDLLAKRLQQDATLKPLVRFDLDPL